MPAQPTRQKVEPGIYERVDAAGNRLGLEVVFKDTTGSTRRRSVAGGIQEARDALAEARTRRVKREREPLDPRVSFNDVADVFESTHVAGLRPASQQAYRHALVRLRTAFGKKRISSITKIDVRAFIAAETREGLKANTIAAHLAALSAIFTFARDDLGIPIAMPRLKPSERPQPADDVRDHRVLADDELARVLAACGERSRLFFRTLAETGLRQSEALGLTSRRVGADTLTIHEQLSRSGKLAPLKTRQSRRTIEVTRGLAAALTLAAGSERVFAHLDHSAIRRAWSSALEVARLDDPQPVIHDLRHTHVSGLIADRWDPVEVAGRIGDTLATTLRVYAHEFDAERRSELRRGALEARYGGGMATRDPLSPAITGDAETAEVANLQVFRNR